MQSNIAVSIPVSGTDPIREKHLNMIEFDLPTDRTWCVFHIPKKTPGEYRKITAPNPELKAVQKLLLKELQADARLSPSAFAHGFVEHRSAITGIRRHGRTADILKIDVKDFFDTFPVKAVEDRLLEVGYTQEQVEKILELCIYNNTIPQGGPCSPFLTNVGMFHTDLQIGAYAKQMHLTYSRYADDLCLAFAEGTPHEVAVKQKKRHVKAITKLLAKTLGLQVNKKKIQFIRTNSPHSSRRVTGIVIRNDGKGYNAPRGMRETTRCRMCNLARKVQAAGGKMTDEDRAEMATLVGYIRYMDGIRVHGGGDPEATTADPRIQEKYWNYLKTVWKQ